MAQAAFEIETSVSAQKTVASEEAAAKVWKNAASEIALLENVRSLAI